MWRPCSTAAARTARDAQLSPARHPSRCARWRGLTPHEAASEEDARQGQPATGLEKERRAPQCATSLLDCGGENHRACATRRQCACASASIDRHGRSTPLNGSKENFNRRAADDDAGDAEGRDGGSAVRGKCGPLARSATRNERERAAEARGGSAEDARGEAEKRTRRRCWSFRRWCEQQSWSKPSTAEDEQIGRVPVNTATLSWHHAHGCGYGCGLTAAPPRTHRW